MKNWLKQQVTEITAWAGAAVIIGAFFLPRSFLVVLGIILIATDDKKAAEWVAKKAPGLAKAIESWKA